MKNLTIFVLLVMLNTPIFAQNIDVTYKYAYGENVGWLNFKPIYGPGITVTDNDVSGYLWAENIGWINLKPNNYGGVINNGIGELSGYAWGENVGWINFNPTVPGDTTDPYRVRINQSGDFEGWAWGENIGWIHLASQSSAYKVKTSWVTSCRVDFADMANFANTCTDEVNWADFSIFTSYWLDYCPYGWPWQ